MKTNWDEATLQSYIYNAVEEGPELDYKASGSLGKQDKKKTEVTKDVSSFANSAGGTIIYGIKEFYEKGKRHLPMDIDPIDRTEISKEWLEHVINSIRPRIDGLRIHPVPLTSNPDNVVYVVEIPMSTTAHQAQDFKYYRRFNFESVPMLDYEIRDVMNRSEMPDLDVEISYKKESIDRDLHRYMLTILVKNVGIRLVNDFKLLLTFPNYGDYISYRKLSQYGRPNFGFIKHSTTELGDHLFTFRSRYKLFPNDEIDVGEQLLIKYSVNEQSYNEISFRRNQKQLLVTWKLFADDMHPKAGQIPFSELNVY